MGRAAIDRPALQRLLSVPVDEFAVDYWAARPLYSPAQSLPTAFSDLFSLAAADELLSQRGLRTPFIRVAKDGAIVDSSRYTASGGAGALVADQVVDDRVLDLFAAGNTIVLQGLHRLWPPILGFAGELTGELGHPVQVNAYITPGESRGFAAHYDVHDVFVLQIAGRKRWIVHEPVYVDPLSTQRWTEHADAVRSRVEEPATLDITLGPGDTLYLPRGFVHAAEALGGVCAHLTVGVQLDTRRAIVEALLDLTAEDPELRRSLALGIDVLDPSQLEPELTDTVAALVKLLEAVSPEEVAGRLERRTRTRTRPAPIAPIASTEALERLEHATTVMRRRGVRALTRVDDDTVVLETARGERRLASAARSAIDVLLSGRPVAIGELGGLEGDAAIVLVRDLIRAGVVVVCETDEHAPLR